VRDFERMGVAGVQIEDQMMPKRCGHEMGRRLVSCEEMCQRIRTIKENRNQENGILIIARTDARTTHGIDEALKRGNTYLESGADIAFIESPESLDEVKRIGREVKGAILFNNVEGGRSPFVSKDVLEQIGFNISIYPNTLSRIMIKSGQKLLKELKDKGSTEKMWDEMLDHRELFELFDHDEWVELEKKYTI